jgi:hypothetical protein
MLHLPLISPLMNNSAIETCGLVRSSAHDCRLASLLADLLNDLLTCSLQVTGL